MRDVRDMDFERVVHRAEDMDLWEICGRQDGRPQHRKKVESSK